MALSLLRFGSPANGVITRFRISQLGWTTAGELMLTPRFLRRPQPPPSANFQHLVLLHNRESDLHDPYVIAWIWEAHGVKRSWMVTWDENFSQNKILARLDLRSQSIIRSWAMHAAKLVGGTCMNTCGHPLYIALLNLYPSSFVSCQSLLVFSKAMFSKKKADKKGKSSSSHGSHGSRHGRHWSHQHRPEDPIEEEVDEPDDEPDDENVDEGEDDLGGPFASGPQNLSLPLQTSSFSNPATSSSAQTSNPSSSREPDCHYVPPSVVLGLGDFVSGHIVQVLYMAKHLTVQVTGRSI